MAGGMVKYFCIREVAVQSPIYKENVAVREIALALKRQLVASMPSWRARMKHYGQSNHPH